jgi:hypothetical protein
LVEYKSRKPDKIIRLLEKDWPYENLF